MAKKDVTSWREVLQGIFSDRPEVLRELVEVFLNELLKLEQEEHVGAGPYERSKERKDLRSGYRPRLLKTRLGSLTLMVPQTRGGFVSAALERYQRSERALLAGIGEMALKGVSTRKVKDVTEAFFGFPVSHQAVSSLSTRLDEELKVWRSRSLEEAYPYLVVDARYEKVRVGHRVASQGVLLVAGVNDRGQRRGLDLMLADTESEATYRELFDRLKDRGLNGVRLIVSDDHKGLKAAIDRCFQGASWQRCQVHFMRNAMARVARKERKELASSLKSVFEAEEMEEALSLAGELADGLRRERPGLAEWIEENIESCLTVYHFPASHRRRIRTTNMLERLSREIKRRTRVVGIFPSPESAERMIGALLIDQDEEWMVSRNYLNMEALNDHLDHLETAQPGVLFAANC